MVNTARPGESALLVGRVVRPHGVRGELVVEVRTDSPEERFAVGAALDGRLRDGSTRTFTVTAARNHSGRLLLTLDGVAGRDAAEELRGTLLTVDREALPPTDDPDEYYDHQLEGLRAELPDGTEIGRVVEVVHGAGSDLLSIQVPERADRVLVPFVQAIVTEVHLAEGRLVVDPPEGLLDET
ncbi:ribosome maturation factor RimM [Actinoalloteichus spitiensis]|uniref:ribosome maturation factor RimM n=1 Tax=Actinoalloteichus spitiensis TaxID=252394 RepID=UPI000381A085